jgi:NAD:arginine ADP-ribosyltransferase
VSEVLKWREVRQSALVRLTGLPAFEAAYARLGLSPEWIDPIFGLDDLERLAIWIYTTPNVWHRIVNEALWGKTQPQEFGLGLQEIETIATTLNAALAKLPRFQGTVYRGIRRKETLASFLRRYRKDGIAVWPGFTSTTRNRADAYAGDVLFRIESMSGRSLQGYSADEYDDEVLFAAGSTYIVGDIEQRPEGLTIIELTEAERNLPL